MSFPQNRRRPNAHFDRPRYNPKARAGLVMTRDMDFGDFGNAEQIFFQEGVSLAPVSCGDRPSGAAITVLATAGLQDIRDHKLTGLVVPGGAGAPDTETASEFDKLINTAKAEKLPVMAFGDGVARALQSLGFEQDGTPPAGVLVHNGVRILETAEDVRDAIASFRAPQKAAA